ncbi:type II secretion system minor pseudopilin GspH [Ferrimonas senticii]|uniref:type II secretion system minor pseudopilin GspH n=1 Tax=Ferrimonas senticii TaxID=394566 RepID=UPI0004103F16|nr:type II secretion system minor pseudopilin GspH [Ferrimonas senticii]
MAFGRRPASYQRGFTLIELLLVVTLIGVMAGAVSLVMGGDKTREAMLAQGNEFAVVIGTALEEAQLTGELMGVVVESDRYFFARWSVDNNHWQTVSGDDRLYRERKLPNTLQFALSVEGLPLDQDEDDEESEFGLDRSLFAPDEEELAKHPEPQLLLFPSGEMTAFNLQISATERGRESLELIGDALGRSRWLHQETEQ